MGSEECDDGNLEESDGCSSLCLIEPYFNCTNQTNNTSSCQLISLNMTVLCSVKDDFTNAFTLTLIMSPSGLKIYHQIDWTIAFSGVDATLNPTKASYDQSSNRLRVKFAYTEDLEDQNIVVNATPASASTSLSAISSTLLELPQRTANNRVLYYYQASVYSLAQAVQYISMAVSALSLLLFAIGYAGAKLQGLEGVAVVQLAALLLLTVDKTGPTYAGLQYLGWSLGATPVARDQYFYEDTAILYSARSQISNFNSISTFNIFLATIILPLVLCPILKNLTVS